MKKAKGTIKCAAEDFIVEEIAQNGTVLELGKVFFPEELGMQESEEGKFTTFVMQKRNWNTAQALKTIARRFSRGIKSTSFAGTKDRTAVSTQLCSIFGVSPEELSSAKIKDITINGAWRSDKKVEMGSLYGNRFTVIVRDASDTELIKNAADSLHGLFPNYFGEQRFGSRGNNVLIGIDILKGDLESATMRFLTDTINERREDSIAARKRLSEELDFAAALEYFPSHLKYERLVIEHLSMMPTDYAGAMRRLPRSITLMLIHSVDAYIFNQELDERIRSGKTTQEAGDIACKADAYGFPDIRTVKKTELSDQGYIFPVASIVGYEQKTNDLEEEIMRKLGITKDMFKVKSMPELNCRGSYRVLFAPFIGFVFEHGAAGSAKLGFSLPSGSYATVLLDQLMDRGMHQE